MALAERVCIVTGAARGIGRATAEALLEEGAKVVLVDHDKPCLDETAAALGQAHGTDGIMSLALDVRDEPSMEGMARDTLDRFGRIDALIASAGILRLGGRPKMVSEMSLEEWNGVVDTNLTGTFLSNRAVLPAMLEQGEGDILNISSTSGREARAFDSAYCASKFGVIGFSDALSQEVRQKGVRIQTLLPDAVDTTIWEQNGTTALRPTVLLQVEDVAKLILYLLDLPREAHLLHPNIWPARTRGGKAKKKRGAEAASGE